MPIHAFDHCTIRAADLERSRRFYADGLGLDFQVHSDLAFPVGLVSVDGRALLHLLQAGPDLDRFMNRAALTYASGPERATGNFEHIAFNASGLMSIVRRLDQLSVSYRERALPEHGVVQLLLEAPDGVELEINFPESE